MSAEHRRAKGMAMKAIPTDPRARRELRRRLSAVAETIIAVLDLLDGDADLEPSLGWTKTMAWGSTDDREEEGGRD